MKKYVSLGLKHNDTIHVTSNPYVMSKIQKALFIYRKTKYNNKYNSGIHKQNGL